jgi:hypothetical protein
VKLFPSNLHSTFACKPSVNLVPIIKCISNSTSVVHQFNPHLTTDHLIHLYLFNFTLSGLDACTHGLYSSLLM